RGRGPIGSVRRGASRERRRGSTRRRRKRGARSRPVFTLRRSLRRGRFLLHDEYVAGGMLEAMSPVPAMTIVLAAAVILLLLLYVFSRVRWTVGDEALVLEWFILGFIRFRTRRMALAEIERVQPYRFREHWKIAIEYFGRNWPR